MEVGFFFFLGGQAKDLRHFFFLVLARGRVRSREKLSLEERTGQKEEETHRRIVLKEGDTCTCFYKLSVFSCSYHFIVFSGYHEILF